MSTGIKRAKVPLRRLNALSRERFIQAIGQVVEHSPWVVEGAFSQRPFADVDELHRAILAVLRGASREQQLAVINAHPDLVGRAAEPGALTTESQREQASAGLGKLSPGEIEQFTRFNAAYREKFGFPFIICARENKKDAILAAFPARLENTREQEIETALREIGRIVQLRLRDAVCEE